MNQNKTDISRETMDVMVFSTAHLSPTACEELDSLAAQGDVGIDKYGYWIFTESFEENSFKHPEIFACLQVALDADCLYARFDGDGPIYKDLPTYDWD